MEAQDILEVERPVLGQPDTTSGEDQEIVRAQAEALAHTRQLACELEEIQNILRPALGTKRAFDWTKLKRTEEYLAPKPSEVVYLEFPPEPKLEDPVYQVAPGDGDTADQAGHEQRVHEAQERYVCDYTAWAQTVKEVESENQRRYAECLTAVEEWNSGLANHRKMLAEHNAAVEKRKSDVASGLPEAVEDYFREVLSSSALPEKLIREFDLQYLAKKKALIVEHFLPTPAILPRIKEVRFIKERGELISLPFSEAALSQLYADVVYQICLRSLYELFDADTADALGGVVFTGWVKAVAKSNGEKTRICMISVEVQKEKFQTLNLWVSDAKDCFKSLGGEGNPTVTALVPAQPAWKIMR